MCEPTLGEKREERLMTALLVDAVQYRQTRGQTTTLRDLHSLLDIPQPVALRIAHKLQEVGVLEIESNMTDAFASTVTVSDTILSCMARGRPCSTNED